MADDYAGAMASGSASDQTANQQRIAAYNKANPQDTNAQWNSAVARLGEAEAAKRFPEWNPANDGKPSAASAQNPSSQEPPASTSSPVAPPTSGKYTPTPANPTVDTTNAQVATANTAMDQLIASYTTAMGQVDPYISGAMGAADAGKATQIGQAIGGAGVQAQNPANAATLTADSQAYQAANDKGAAGVTKALGDVRSADAQALQVSPYSGLLAALTSGTTYRAETNPQTGALPGSAATMPAWLQDAYSNAVGSNALSVSGATTPGAGTSAGTTAATTPSTDTTGATGGP